MAVVAVNVRPATVTELPAASDPKLTTELSKVAAAPCVVDIDGAGVVASDVKSLTLPWLDALKATLVPFAEPLDHPDKVPEKLPETDPEV